MFCCSPQKSQSFSHSDILNNSNLGIYTPQKKTNGDWKLQLPPNGKGEKTSTQSTNFWLPCGCFRGCRPSTNSKGASKRFRNLPSERSQFFFPLIFQQGGNVEKKHHIFNRSREIFGCHTSSYLKVKLDTTNTKR